MSRRRDKSVSSYPGGGGLKPSVGGPTILILGVLGIALCQLLGPVAWLMGDAALDKINRGEGEEGELSAVNAGRICGIIATGLLALAICLIGAAMLARPSSSPAPSETLQSGS